MILFVSRKPSGTADLSVSSLKAAMENLREQAGIVRNEPHLIVVHPDRYELTRFIIAIGSNPDHPFLIFLKRLYKRARGRARFKTLLHYAREETGNSETWDELERR